VRKSLLKHGTRIAVLAGSIAIAISVARFGWRGGVGLAAGIVAAWTHLWLLWRIISTLGEASKEQPVVKQGTGMIVLGFFLQLPIFGLLGIGASRLGPSALSCFVAGVGMVYFGLVGWAVART